MGFLSSLFGLDLWGSKNLTLQTREAVCREWKNIETLKKKGGPSQLRQALISADKTLDNVMRDLFDGETMGERLKNAKTRFDQDTYNRIWNAHKTRNALVHESGYEPSYYLLEEAIDTLKNAVEQLGVTLWV
ncbi:hypothetical protein HYV31_02375 [candidate division WWE3 bacterium]|nr:hypothetical protein [candidate division WWE3 bacterium]